jgi:hypothetical protein
MSVLADGGGHGVLGVGSQGLVLLVVGERAAAGAQVVDQCRGLRGTDDLPGLAWMPWDVFVAGEQDR